MMKPVDGISLRPLFSAEVGERKQPIGFRFGRKSALVDNQHKLVTENLDKGKFQLYDLAADPKESHDLSAAQPERAARMRQELLAWVASVDASFAGKDYPEGKVTPPDQKPQLWFESTAYQPYLPAWKDRWEYKRYIERHQKPGKKSGDD